MNNDGIPTFEAYNAKIETVLSDSGREFCGRPDQHPYELFLQLEEIEHRTTRVKRPQSNGIIERFHRTLLDEHFRVEGRKTWFETIEEMQVVLDEYLIGYNTKRPHQGRGMNGRTPLVAFREGLPNQKPKRRKPSPKNRPTKSPPKPAQRAASVRRLPSLYMLIASLNSRPLSKSTISIFALSGNEEWTGHRCLSSDGYGQLGLIAARDKGT